MGEVYRTDDLRLGQQVALKLLSKRIQEDPRSRRRFLDEIRLARRISHPNVCRVFDVGEVDGRLFLTMEYVDGEDLECLLRRIGHVPRDKALQIARQFLSGLAAIHALGVLHRDLKPANLMLDAGGQLRITDFGVAALAGEIPEGEIGGTPAYMAPESLGGGAASVRSDLYSLGLVLWEVFSGRKVFPSVGERLRGSEEGRPDPLPGGVGPAIEDALLHCLEQDPENRPTSCAEVLASLPGGDPLEAMVADGQTPSPQMVAAAGGKGLVSAKVGVSVLAAIVAGVLGIGLVAGQVMLFGRAGLSKPPELLAEKAREILQSLGHEPGGDVSYGFGNEEEALDYLEADPSRWAGLDEGRIPGMYFWYRQSLTAMVPNNALGIVDAWDPPAYTPGTANIVLDPRGRLLEFQAPPAVQADRPSVSLEPDWRPPFAAAGLDFNQFARVSSDRAPPIACDACSAWEGSYGGGVETPVRVEAGSSSGRPVFFRLTTPWGGPILDQRAVSPRSASALYNALLVLVVAGSLLEARRNLRRGRGDRVGARRLALYVLSITLVQWLLRANHSTGVAAETQLLIGAVSLAAYKAILLCWVPYIALEPRVRRLWPKKVASWARLLAGRFADPLVGRDVLFGLCGAVALQVVLRLYFLVPGWIGRASPRPEAIWPDTLLGPRHFLSEVLRFQDKAIFFGFGLLLLLVFLQWALRVEWLAVLVGIGLVAATWYGEIPTFYPVWSAVVTGLRIAGFVFLLRRFGLLPVIVAIFFDSFLNTFPVALDLSAWYAESTVFALGLVIGLSSAALWVALGRPRAASPPPRSPSEYSDGRRAPSAAPTAASGGNATQHFRRRRAPSAAPTAS